MISSDVKNASPPRSIEDVAAQRGWTEAKTYLACKNIVTTGTENLYAMTHTHLRSYALAESLEKKTQMMSSKTCPAFPCFLSPVYKSLKATVFRNNLSVGCWKT